MACRWVGDDVKKSTATAIVEVRWGRGKNDVVCVSGREGADGGKG